MTSRSSARPPSVSFGVLDGLRGVGALIVMVGHYGLLGRWLDPAGGSAVVDIFFMLSGFVIAFSYEPRFHKGMGAGAFMLQRLVRLYPLYLLGILIGGAMFIASAIKAGDGPVPARLVQLILQMAVLPTPEVGGEDALYPFNFPAWTMFFELWINVVYVLLWPLLKNTRVLIGCVVIGAAALAVTALRFGGLDVGENWQTSWGGFARAAFGFFAGVLIFRLTGSPTRPTARTGWRRLALFPAFLIALVAPAPAWLRPFLDFALVTLIGPATIWVGQAFQPPPALAGLFGYLGGISYAVYVLHIPIWTCAQHILWRLPAEAANGPGPRVVTFFVVIAAAMLADRFCDRPIRGWIKRWLKRRHHGGSNVAAGASAGARPGV
jgi:peptidoglycan/LPS O-acetylase OafA/YrhL